MIDLDAMSAEEREQVLAECFKWTRKNGGRLPFGAYREKVQTFHTPFIDLAVVFVPEIGSPEVLLELRPEKAHLYAGLWNIAGGNFQHRETLIEASTRLSKDSGCSGTPVFAGVATYVKTREEVGMSFFYVIVIAVKPQSLPNNWQFFPLDELPNNFVPWERSAYPKMIRNFLAGKPPGVYEYLGED